MRRLLVLSVLLVFGSVAYADYEMSDSEKERYLRWAKQLKLGGDFALAVAPNGCYDLASWWGGMHQARKKALARCEKKCLHIKKAGNLDEVFGSNQWSTCKIMDVNGTSAFIKQRGSSSSSSTASSSQWVWCATASSVLYMKESSCNSSGRNGKSYSSKHLAEAEHQRLKGYRIYCYDPSLKLFYASAKCADTDRTVSEQEYSQERLKGTTAASSSGKGWCATASSVLKVKELACRYKGGKSYATQALAQAEHQRLKEAATPVVKTATLTLRSNVKDDRVYIDGNFKGSTRLALDLPKGQHTIRIEKEGYEPYEETVNLTDNLIIRGHLAKVIEQPAQTTTAQPLVIDKTAEIEFWKSIKDSNDRDMYRAYIDQFPEGVYVSLAKIKLKTLGGDSAVATIPDIAYGDYYALVIGNNEYQHLSDLDTAVNDAKAVAQVLKDDYAFTVKVLTNATRAETLDTFSRYRGKVSAKDNLLIYFAGHGYLDKDADEGYWLPVDAVEDSFTNWISNSSVIASVRGMQAKHVIVVADSCFSGTLVRAVKIAPKTPDYLQKIVKRKARTALTSGGLEPVTDVGGGQHSVFARSFISLLQQNPAVMNGQELFSALRREVQLNSDQLPEYGDIRKAGHDGGDFLFVRQ